MKHDSPHSLGESPSSPAVTYGAVSRCGTMRGGMKQSPSAGGMKQSPSSGGMTTEIETTPIEICDIAFETTPVFGWGWPDEALLAAFAEEDDQVEQPDGPLEDSSEYAILYFVS